MTPRAIASTVLLIVIAITLALLSKDSRASDWSIDTVDIHLRAWHSHDHWVHDATVRQSEQARGVDTRYNNQTPGIGVTLNNNVAIGIYRHSYYNATDDARGPLDGHAVYINKSWRLTTLHRVQLRANLSINYGYGEIEPNISDETPGEIGMTETYSHTGYRFAHTDLHLIPTLGIRIPTSRRVNTNITLAPGIKENATLAAMLTLSIKI